MSNEVVKYNNELNYIQLPKFTGRQQDLFFSILSQIKDKHNNSSFLKRFFDSTTRELIIPYKNFVDICRIKDWNRSFVEVYKEIENFLNILLKYNLSYRTQGTYYTFVCFEEARHDTIEQTICITFQKRFYDIVVNHSLGFTRFELAEFIALDSKYTKTLYRLLKQYRHTGKLHMDLQEFKRLLQIPVNYRQIDIDQRILRPAIAELTRKITLFDNKRIPFKKLSYKKIKQGGNKVVAIEFSFLAEERHITKEQRAEQMEKTIHDLNEHELKTKYEGIDFETDKGESMKIFNLSINKDTKHIEVTFKNRENNTTYTNTYENLSKLNGYLSKFGVIMK